ncbi:hypothetical protein ABIF35_006567 [Bradyrhizobium japonicum]|uniref:hypothetical protein n=1 Tax=Bradyrhizobium diazoefficiens TaxID=1355477 RepID=UPI003487619B
MVIRISRLELYELVSKSPLSKVAPGLGISATALAEICRTHNVPYPGSGYWTRKSLGQAVTLDPLPPEPAEQPIEIEPSKPRARRTETRTADVTAQVPNSPEPATSTATAVKERLTKPHPIIASWVADRERRRREAAASRDPWRIRNAPAPLSEIDHRRHAILEALFRALEGKGAKIAEAEKGLLSVTIEGEKIEFQVREKSRQVKISPQDKRSSYLSQELVGTGKLVFAIRTYLRGPHNEEWCETDSKPLESRLPAIVDRLFEGARILKAWHIEQEQERERWRQEAARRAERERLAKQEQKRRERLCELARNWVTAAQIRELLAVVKSKPFPIETGIDGKSLTEWMAWAEGAADALDATRDGAEGLFAIIAAVKGEPGYG